MAKPISQLVSEIKNELREDLSRYDDDYDSWVEVVNDCPSNTLENLYGEVIDTYGEPRFVVMMENEIEPFINSLNQ